MVKQSNFQRWIATVSEAPIEPLADGTHVPQRAKRIERDWASLNDKRFSATSTTPRPGAVSEACISCVVVV